MSTWNIARQLCGTQRDTISAGKQYPPLFIQRLLGTTSSTTNSQCFQDEMISAVTVAIVVLVVLVILE
jgi:hypothetical protein